MTDNTRFRVNTKVVHETFEDELVIVNLDNGNYYTLSGAGADVWTLIEAGASTAEIASSLLSMYAGSPAIVTEGVTHLVASLVAEDLITADPTRTAAPGSLDATPASESKLRTFETPVLQKYMDMQTLLLLDPIHEVDESGWPMPQADQG